MSERQEFVIKAMASGANLRQLCREYHVSPTTAYKWLDRYRSGESLKPVDRLTDRSRRPHRSPDKTDATVEALIVELRARHPAWGARKLRARLAHQGHTGLPAVSTVNAILRRHGLLDPVESLKHHAWERFEHPNPNDLWQMDFKGDIQVGGKRLAPLTVLDDHSRFAVRLSACPDQTGRSVQQELIDAFRSHGLPLRMTMDNGTPWGIPGRAHEAIKITTLTAWLMRLGIRISHSRPFHPQTQGKDERFHRTLKVELLRYNIFENREQCQQAFDLWRDLYNQERPHEAIGLAPPVSRYRNSDRCYPEVLPLIEYQKDDVVRKVQGKGEVSLLGKTIQVSHALHGERVAFRPTGIDGLFELYFCSQQLQVIDLR